VRRPYRPLLITSLALLGFVAVAVVWGVGGWGPPAANEQAIGEVSRWCERVSGGFLREPVNTLANLGFVVSGLAMLLVLARDQATGSSTQNRMIGPTPIALLYAGATVFLGPGSMVMHGTHTFFGAWLDNVSMVAFITVPWLFNLAEMARWRDRTMFTLYASIVIAYGAGYWFIGPDLGVGFELFRVSIPLWLVSEFVYRFWSPTVRLLSGAVGFVVAAAFGITPAHMLANIGEYWWFPVLWLPGLVARKPPGSRRTYAPWFYAGVASFLAAYAIWQTGHADHPWCRPDSLIQAHAIWHLLSAVATWCFFRFLRTERRLPSPHDAIPELMR
jgi:hypothetical protein